jgi:hypothetical protein
LNGLPPHPPSGFAHHRREQNCPAGEYVIKTVAYSGVTPNHTCTPCDCQAGGLCSATVRVNSAADCMGTTYKTCITNGLCCSWTDQTNAVTLALDDASGAACTPTGGAVQGADVLEDPFTYCCLP